MQFTKKEECENCGRLAEVDEHGICKDCEEYFSDETQD
jgi:hypothetical protein